MTRRRYDEEGDPIWWTLSLRDKLIVIGIISVTFSGIPLAFTTGNADWLWTLALLIFFMS